MNPSLRPSPSVWPLLFSVIAAQLCLFGRRFVAVSLLFVPTVSFDKERDFQNEEFYFSDSKYW